MKRLLPALLAATTLAIGANAAAADKGHGPTFGWSHNNWRGGDRGHHGGRWDRDWGHHDHGSRSHFSFNLGFPLYSYPYGGYRYPTYYYRPYYYNPYPTTVVIERQPPVYVERPAPSVEATADNYWYYCADTRTYYPYTQTCPSDWLQVVPPTSP